jgi:hypothetical protein
MCQNSNYQNKRHPLVCSLLVEVPPLMKALAGIMLVTTTPVLVSIHPVIAMLSFLLGLVWLTTANLDRL